MKNGLKAAAAAAAAATRQHNGVFHLLSRQIKINLPILYYMSCLLSSIVARPHSTASTTWTTPLPARTSAPMTLASPTLDVTVTVPSSRLVTATNSPDRVGTRVGPAGRSAEKMRWKTNYETAIFPYFQNTVYTHI